MFVFVNFLKRQSPTPQLASYGHGTIALPDGRRWNPGLTPKNQGGKSERK
ncbi:phage filamentation protein Fil family protein [Pantoea sp. SORGH_AS_0659]|nr:phage filamentation protein Fil family protein [Pantoea sp. SORGH_AS_0659]